MLGLLSGVLGGFLYIFQCRTLCTSGAALWTGVVVSMADDCHLPVRGDRNVALSVAWTSQPSVWCHRMLVAKKMLMM